MIEDVVVNRARRVLLVTVLLPALVGCGSPEGGASAGMMTVSGVAQIHDDAVVQKIVGGTRATSDCTVPVSPPIAGAVVKILDPQGAEVGRGTLAASGTTIPDDQLEGGIPETCNLAFEVRDVPVQPGEYTAVVVGFPPSAHFTSSMAATVVVRLNGVKSGGGFSGYCKNVPCPSESG